MSKLLLKLSEAFDLAYRASRAHGASEALAKSLADATLSAEAHGQSSVGLRHLLDYLPALKGGGINGNAQPVITVPAPALTMIDADGGIAQLGFDLAFVEFVTRTRTFGISLLTIRHSFTTGELGYYARRLSEQGLVAFAATNGPALITVPGASKPVYCTNPFAFSAPQKDGPPLLIDQSSSATAWVNLARASELGEPIPAGWAVDETGQPTTDARTARRGALLAFGGSRGANIALMVEVLAAGLSGAKWSIDAPGFANGIESLDAGLTIVAIAPHLLDPEFETRLAKQLDRLLSFGIHIPGERKARAATEADDKGVYVDASVVEQLKEFIRNAAVTP